VDLGGDEVQPLHQVVTLDRAECGRERPRLAVGDVLQQHRDLGEARAVVELEQRHVALGIDRVVVGAVGELVGAQVDLDRLGRDAGLDERDVGANEQAPGA